MKRLETGGLSGPAKERQVCVDSRPAAMLLEDSTGACRKRSGAPAGGIGQ